MARNENRDGRIDDAEPLWAVRYTNRSPSCGGGDSLFLIHKNHDVMDIYNRSGAKGSVAITKARHLAGLLLRLKAM